MSIEPPAPPPLLPPGTDLLGLLDSLATGVLLFDPDCRLRLVNSQARELLGGDLRPGLPLKVLDDDTIDQAVRQALAGTRFHRREFLYEPADRDPVWLRLDVRPLMGAIDQPLGALVTLFEATERNRTEREMWQAEKMSALGRLAASVAHEICNPLGAIDIQLQLLQEDLEGIDGPLRDKATRRLHIARGEMRRLNGIVQNFLRFSRPPRLHLADIAPNDLLRHIFTLLDPEARERGIDLVLDLEDEQPTLRADDNLLSQALLNILINAFQAAGKAPRVTIESRWDRRTGHLVWRIIDNGHGIEAEILEHIFEFYYTTKAEGTGLGLSIAQRIVHQHDGTLSVASRPGQGTEITVRLPA